MDELYFKFKNDARQFKHNLALWFNKEEKKLLKENAKYHGIYQGKRCFILGNGPSLKKQDLSQISNDIVFTVNMLPKSPSYSLLRNDFHVMLDPFIFKFNLNKKEDREKLEFIKKINKTDNHPICFLPYKAKNIIDELGLSKCLKISYLDIGGDFYEGYKDDIDLTKNIPGFYNVVQFAIVIAIYMGFKEVYLLGCDMTGYEQISVLEGKKVELHVYEMNENEKKAIKNTHTQLEPEEFFRGFYRTFADYRRLREYAERRGTYIYNATAGGVLEAFVRVDYNKLFER